MTNFYVVEIKSSFCSIFCSEDNKHERNSNSNAVSRSDLLRHRLKTLSGNSFKRRLLIFFNLHISLSQDILKLLASRQSGRAVSSSFSGSAPNLLNNNLRPSQRPFLLKTYKTSCTQIYFSSAQTLGSKEEVIMLSFIVLVASWALSESSSVCNEELPEVDLNSPNAAKELASAFQSWGFAYILSLIHI